MTVAFIVLAAAVVAFTIATAVIDYQYRKIPNKLTLPMFLAGIVYQIAFGYTMPGSTLLDTFCAFLFGFGLLFFMWFAGMGGAGDAKLMGALSVWMGFWGTVWVFGLSAIFVILGSLVVLIFNSLTMGFWKTRAKYLATGKEQGKGPRQIETLRDKQQRRLMTFALPIALSCLVALTLMQIKPQYFSKLGSGARAPVVNPQE